MSEYRYTLHRFIRDWMLIIAMAAGAGAYLLYHTVPELHFAGPVLLKFCKTIQPVLLFLMLFISFSRVEPKNLKPEKWQFFLLAIQGAFFAGICLLIVWAGQNDGMLARWICANKTAVEAFMLCMVCPTATACAVVTGKLGGSMAGVITYTVMVNLMVAFLVPALVPVLYPAGGISFGKAFLAILSKVFPLLILPCLTSWAVRYAFPKFHEKLYANTSWAFYIWAISLTLALVMSTRALVHSGNGVTVLGGIALASLVSCIFQFWAGKRIGSHFDSKITAGQALGQKNTVFAIWLGYTFLDPVTSVAGGFYSIWHNLFNTWQLYRRRKEIEKNGQ